MAQGTLINSNQKYIPSRLKRTRRSEDIIVEYDGLYVRFSRYLTKNSTLKVYVYEELRREIYPGGTAELELEGIQDVHTFKIGNIKPAYKLLLSPFIQPCGTSLSIDDIVVQNTLADPVVKINIAIRVYSCLPIILAALILFLSMLYFYFFGPH